MTPDPDDPLHREIKTVDDAKRLFMEHALGMHTYRVSYGGDKYKATITDVFNTVRGMPLKPMDYALRKLRREVLWKNVTVEVNRWGMAHIVLFTQAGTPLPHEEFAGHELQQFCLRVLELCAAWEGVDKHLDT